MIKRTPIRGPWLRWCRRCVEYTYWKENTCQRCLQVRQAKIRGILIAVACVIAFAWSVIKLYWRDR